MNKKGLTLILAFLLPPAVPILTFFLISSFFEGQVAEKVLIPDQFIIAYIVFFILFLIIALPAYFLLLIVPGLIGFWIVVLFGWLGGYLVVRLSIGLDPQSDLSVVPFGVTGMIMGILFWLILKAGGANLPD